MPRIDLDKIILQKKVYGVDCPACGGSLRLLPNPARPWWRRLWARNGRHRYECSSCLLCYDLRQHPPAN